MKIHPIVKGACIGIAAGTAAYMATSSTKYPSRRRRKVMKKRAESAISAVGSAINDISHMFK